MPPDRTPHAPDRQVAAGLMNALSLSGSRIGDVVARRRPDADRQRAAAFAGCADEAARRRPADLGGAVRPQRDDLRRDALLRARTARGTNDPHAAEALHGAARFDHARRLGHLLHGRALDPAGAGDHALFRGAHPRLGGGGAAARRAQFAAAMARGGGRLCGRGAGERPRRLRDFGGGGPCAALGVFLGDVDPDAAQHVARGEQPGAGRLRQRPVRRRHGIADRTLWLSGHCCGPALDGRGRRRRRTRAVRALRGGSKSAGAGAFDAGIQLDPQRLRARFPDLCRGADPAHLDRRGAHPRVGRDGGRGRAGARAHSRIRTHRIAGRPPGAASGNHIRIFAGG